MPCNPEVLKDVPLFALLDDEEAAVLAGQVEMKRFSARQRIYKIDDPNLPPARSCSTSRNFAGTASRPLLSSVSEVTPRNT